MGLGCQVGKKPCYLRFGHFCRMTLVVEKNKPFNPVDIRFLGPRTVVECSDRLADLIEQLWLRRHHGRFNRAAARDWTSLQWIYFGAFHVVSSREGRRSTLKIQRNTCL